MGVRVGVCVGVLVGVGLFTGVSVASGGWLQDWPGGQSGVLGGRGVSVKVGVMVGVGVTMLPVLPQFLPLSLVCCSTIS